MKSESLVSAVLFDFGGVIPQAHLKLSRDEEEMGVPTDSIRKLIQLTKQQRLGKDGAERSNSQRVL